MKVQMMDGYAQLSDLIGDRTVASQRHDARGKELSIKFAQQIQQYDFSATYS